MTSTTKKLLLGAILIVAIGGYIYWSSAQNSAAAPVATDTTSTPVDTTSPNPTGTTTTTTTVTPAPTTTAGAFKDGTYTGEPTTLEYGTLQIAVTVSGGKISDVKFLEAPQGDDHTNEVTSMSEPILKSETIGAQSANVSIVTGATQTSEAYQQTLKAVLSQAQA